MTQKNNTTKPTKHDPGGRTRKTWLPTAKELFLVLWLCVGCAFVSCGTAATKPVPGHLTVGEKETEKGLQWYKKGCYRKSLHHFYRAYERFSMADMVDGVAMSLNNLGTIHRALGNWDAALAAFDEAGRLYTNLDDPTGAATALSNKAATFIRMGELNNAEQTLERAFALSVSTAPHTPSISLLQNKAVLLTKQRRYREAETILAKCLKQTGSLSPLERASLHFAFGNVMLQSNRPSKALASFQNALSLDRQVGFFQGMADDLCRLAEAYIRLDQKEKAVEAWKRAVKILALLDLNHEVDNTMEHLRETAHKTKIDISVTEDFVERWRQGRLYESPCEE
jgi:tetratricopeptide (TPR) repeat protein